MIPTKLSEDEMCLISNAESGDHILLEVIKGMSLIEMKGFDVYKPKYMKHYTDIQMKWLGTEKHILESCTGRSGSGGEFIEDLRKHNNAERFRAFYVLKYPDMVIRII